MHLCICIYLYMYIYIRANLPVIAIVRLPHSGSRGSHSQEAVLAPSADKQICNY